MVFVTLSRQIPEWILKTKDTVLLVFYCLNSSSEDYLATDHFLPCCHGQISRLVGCKFVLFIVYPAFNIQNWSKKESTKNTQLKINIQRSWDVCFWNSLLKFEAEKCFSHYHLRLLPSLLLSLSHFYLRLISQMNYNFIFQMAEFRAPVQTHENLYGVTMSHYRVRQKGRDTNGFCAQICCYSYL